MSTANPDDVRDEITTKLEDPDIQDSLDRAQEWNEAANSPSNQSTTETRNIELYWAIINIRQHKEPAVEEDDIGGSAMVYEGGELERAKSELAKWLSIAGEDPTAASSLLRDSNRYTTSGRASSADSDRSYR